MSGAMHRLGLVLALLLASCADNAILEVELDLPADTDGTTTYAFVQSLSADPVTFDGEWAGADATDGFALTASPTVQHVSFVTSGDAMTRPLGIRVRFCSDRHCATLADARAPEARYVVDRPFYRGHRTSLTLAPMPSVAPTVTDITKCQVRGCTSGTPTSYCHLGTETHFCE